MTLRPKVALSNDFLIQLARLPAAIHTKVMRWAVKFQADPTSNSINYENIQAARDRNLKSVRIDQAWRGIVFKPVSGDVYVLLHVDHHDKAYHWAENRKLTINPVTGAMQLVMLVEEVEAGDPPTRGEAKRANTADPLEGGAEAASTPASEPAGAPAARGVADQGSSPPLFSNLDDQALMSLGVPQELLPLVRQIEDEGGLDTVQSQLPVEAYEGLFLFAAGDTFSQILASRETRVDRQIDTADFAAALETAESRSRFVVTTDDESLVAILNAPLAQWRVFLHPTQQRLAIGDRSGPVRVLGGAGTGKTVLAMHRAKWLAEHRTEEGQTVLFTTFTRNLATDIEQNLKTLCSPATLARLEVRNLDAWVSHFLRSRRLEHRIVYDHRQEGAHQAWQAALTMRDPSLDLPDGFYEQELAQVILAQGITTRDAYRRARRIGRGVTLSRGKRDAAWPVFEEYRGQLASRKLKTVDDAYREIADLLNTAHQAREKDPQLPAPTPYSAIVIDETQDLGPQALRLLRAMIPPGSNDLFFVGDGHQRIYTRHRSAMSRDGIDIRGRSSKLYINYRTTDEIRRRAVALLEGVEIDDLDDGRDESLKYRSLSHGPEPEVIEVDGLEAAYQAVSAFMQGGSGPQDGAAPLTWCLITASRSDRDALGRLAGAEGLKTVSISAQSNHTGAQGVLHLATMHRAKGLEFDGVAVVAPGGFLDAVPEDGNQRQLLYVALTRAKRWAQLVLY